MTAAKIIATAFGIGYIQKGAGTAAALFYCAVWWYGQMAAWTVWLQALHLTVLFAAGVWAGNAVEKDWGHDSNRVVIDEVLGMAVVLLTMPRSLPVLLVAFLLFRVFDILKPFGIRRTESLPGGLGVMMDDALAGVYSWLLLHLALYLNHRFHLNLTVA